MNNLQYAPLAWSMAYLSIAVLAGLYLYFTRDKD